MTVRAIGDARCSWPASRRHQPGIAYGLTARGAPGGRPAGSPATLSGQVDGLQQNRLRSREPTQPVLATMADHNGTRRGPIAAEASVAQLQMSDCPGTLGVFRTQMLSIAPAAHTAAGIMPGGRGCPTYWWGLPG
jgi:hypothetical protein